MNQRDKWVEIDFAKILNNLYEVRSLLPAEVRLIAVIKADAYGHGAVKTAQLLSANGVDFLAVTYLEEALTLREAGIDKQIMIFSPLNESEQYITALEQNITLTISSIREGQELDRISRGMENKGKVHLKIDTGLGRFGLNAAEAIQICQTFKENHYIEIEGIYTHMADAANSEKYTQQQFRDFIKIAAGLEKEGYKFSLKHCANSAVFLQYPHMYLQAVRIGTLLTGQQPAGKFSTTLNLQDPYKFKSRIIAVHHREKGSYLGYYRTYRLKQAAQIAVIPVGYVDGLALTVQNPPTGFLDMLKLLLKQLFGYLGIKKYSMLVKIRGAYFPIRGKVFMQNCLAEIPEDFPVMAGDEVELPVRKTLADKSIAHVYMNEAGVYSREKNYFRV
ncbi:MAG TPA: alanine racemase [Syntrophomonadaceae bacterium]|nr:alanine racemase [Syntrophomonadaceae bacterium]HNX28154.1 alanine racemase [Syntrophomonadaceae bacterium]HPR93443.1 alanine racemase [Syntrophomonadaceae bacterium]